VAHFYYDYTSDSFISNDITILADHLTAESNFKDWTYQQTPESILLCLREDGKLASCTFQPHHRVVGWYRFDTQGEFKAVTAIPGQASRQDDVWCIVKREINGTDKYYLEKFAPWFGSESAVDGLFLDCHHAYSGDPTNVITGLEHLEGMEVSVLADGTVHPPVTVASGTISLNAFYSKVVVGFNYTSEVWPVLAELPLPDGTNVGRTQRIMHLDIHFFRTLGCEIGRWSKDDGEEVEEKPFRVPKDVMGEQSPLFTGIVRYDFREGYDNDIRYFIRQRQHRAWC
jgi:hypothetical protein